MDSVRVMREDAVLMLSGPTSGTFRINFLNIAKHFKSWANGTPMGIGSHTYKVLMIGDYSEKPFEVSHMVWKMSGCLSLPYPYDW